MAEVVEFSVMSAIPNPFAGPVKVTDFAVPEKAEACRCPVAVAGKTRAPKIVGRNSQGHQHGLARGPAQLLTPAGYSNITRMLNAR